MDKGKAAPEPLALIELAWLQEIIRIAACFVKMYKFRGSRFFVYSKRKMQSQRVIFILSLNI